MHKRIMFGPTRKSVTGGGGGNKSNQMENDELGGVCSTDLDEMRSSRKF